MHTTQLLVVVCDGFILSASETVCILCILASSMHTLALRTDDGRTIGLVL